MTSPVDIRPDHLEIMQGILREHLPMGVKVWVFGSRTNWTTKDSSDLDLALDGESKLSHKLLGALKDAFEDSTLPYTVDVVDLNAVSHAFKQIVKEQRVALPSVRASERVGAAWREVVLGDVCTKIGSGATPRGGRDVYLAEGPYTLIRSQNVYNDGFHRDGLAFIGERHADELKNVEIFQEDVLLNITGDSVARVCQVAPDVLPARVNQHVAIIRPDSVNLDAGYLRYCLVTPGMQTLLLSWAGSGGTRNALTKGMIESLEIPLPALSEQRAIARVLGTLDDKIELNRRMNETLEAMARALFKSWFVDFEPVRAKMEGRWRRGESLPGLPAEHYDMFPDRLVNSELGEIPEGWEVVGMGDVIEIHDSRRVPLNSRQRVNRQGPYPYYGAAGIMDYVDDFLFDGIYVLTGEDGSVINASGHPIVQYVWGQFWANNHAHVLKGKNGISEEHLNLLLQRQIILPFVTGAVQPKLSQHNLKAIPMVLPAVSVCKAFSDLIQPMFAAMRSHTDEALTLAVERDALLPRLVSGGLCSKKPIPKPF